MGWKEGKELRSNVRREEFGVISRISGRFSSGVRSLGRFIST